MSIARPHSSLAARALSIYLSHSFQAALNFKTNLDSCYCSIEDPLGSAYPLKMYKRLEELVQYLQVSVCVPTTPHELASQLAVIDRLRDSICWTILGKGPISHWFGEDVYKYSADMLRFSIIAERSGDAELSREWITASSLTDMYMKAPQPEHHGTIPAPPALSGDFDRITNLSFISRYATVVLKTCSTLLPHGRQTVLDHYQRRGDLLRLLQGFNVSMQGKQNFLTTMPARDERVRPLHTLEYDLVRNSLAQLSDSKGDLLALVEQIRTREGRQDQLGRLRTTITEAITELDKCGTWLAKAAQGDCTELRERLEELCEARDNIIRDVHEACQSEGLQSIVDSTGSAWLRLQGSANALRANVRAIQPEVYDAVQRCNLAAFYKAEAARTAQIQPNTTPFRTKIAACWEQAALSIVADPTKRQTWVTPRHQQYVELAEGVFASVVTCHTQWERAVQRRDAKLADFWQSARERAWAVGCAAFEALQSNAAVKRDSLRISDAVQRANHAQELITTPGAYTLALAEADLQLVLADMLITYPYEERNTPSHRRLVRHGAKLALEVIALFRPVPNFAWSGSLPAVTATEEVCATLRWCSCALEKLHALSSIDSSKFWYIQAWQGAADLITAMLTHLKTGGDGAQDAALTSQRTFLAELMQRSLEAASRNEVACALWLERLANAYSLVLPDGVLLSSLTKGVRARIIKLRLQLARAVETEVSRASADVAQWLTTQWPEAKRGVPVLTAQNVKQSPAGIVGIVAAYRGAVEWKQRAEEEAVAGSDLFYCLIDGAERWVVLADHRRQRTEHCEHGKLEGQTGNIYATAALTARGDGLELEMGATEAGLRALQEGKTELKKACNGIGEKLKSVTRLDKYVYSGTKKAPMDIDSAERVVAQILLCAEHSLRAVTAELEGKSSLAEAWRTAAQTREKALLWGYSYDVACMLCRDSPQTLKRADALAEQARALEEQEAIT